MPTFADIGSKVERQAIAQAVECVGIMDVTGSRGRKVWSPDGLNCPGQANLLQRQERLADPLPQVYDRIGEHQRRLLEYELFEPAFHATDLPADPMAACLGSGYGERTADERVGSNQGGWAA